MSRTTFLIGAEHRHYHGGLYLNQRLGEFLCRAMGCSDYNSAVDQLYRKRKNGALYSDNGCLMVIPDGFRSAATIADAIEGFLYGNGN